MEGNLVLARALVVISTTELEKAILGILWAATAFKEGWINDVELYFFGPVEKLIADRESKLIDAINQYKALGKTPIACETVAKKLGITEKLQDVVDIGPVGKLIGELMDEGYIPLIY